MALVKSTLIGLLSLFSAAVLYLVVLFIRLTKPKAGTAIGIDPVSIFRSSPLCGLVAMAVFALGFYWEYRRLKPRRLKN